MSQKNSTAAAWRWGLALLLVSAGAWFWFNRQFVIDSLAVFTYSPSQEIEAITERTDFTRDGEFYFYASQPTIESSSKFNKDCNRREANSPILGCYDGMRIYLYDVTDKRLDGIKEVTAAHEMLHAAYDRLSEDKKQQLTPLLQRAYDRVKTKEFINRMAYYERTEPGEFSNELHSILATEFTDIGAELESYYETYFNDRSAIVALHNKAEKQFDILKSKGDELVSKIDALAGQINDATQQYNTASRQLNADITNFNSRANQTGGFNSQAEFESVRDALAARSNQLIATRNQIESNIAVYKTLVAQLNALNTEASSLNQSLDSTLTPAPEL